MNKLLVKKEQKLMKKSKISILFQQFQKHFTKNKLLFIKYIDNLLYYCL